MSCDKYEAPHTITSAATIQQGRKNNTISFEKYTQRCQHGFDQIHPEKLKFCGNFHHNFFFFLCAKSYQHKDEIQSKTDCVCSIYCTYDISLTSLKPSSYYIFLCPQPLYTHCVNMFIEFLAYSANSCMYI